MSNVVSKCDMIELYDQMLYDKARAVYDDIWGQARSMGRHVKIYLHWTAGHYNQFWDSYHIQINDDGKMYCPPDTSFADVLSGTYKRNTGSIGITMLGCCDITSNDIGSEPPTQAQIESMARAIAIVANALDLTIDKVHVMTHGEAADNEDGIYPHEEYGPKNGCERWDLEFLGTSESPKFNPYATDGSRGGDVLRGKANWYRNYWKENGTPYNP